MAPNLLKTHLFLLSRLVEQSSLALLCKNRLIYFVLLHFCCIFIVHLVILVYSVYFVQTVQHFGELRYFKCTIETLICLDFLFWSTNSAAWCSFVCSCKQWIWISCKQTSVSKVILQNTVLSRLIRWGYISFPSVSSNIEGHHLPVPCNPVEL